MKKLDLTTKLGRTFSMTGLKIKKYSPEILIGAGVIGAVTSTVLACKATLKLDQVLADSNETIEQINNYAEENGYSEKYTESDASKDLMIVKVQTGVKIAKLYAPAVALGALSIACMVKSHDILNKRNAALAAAYTAVDKSFKEYRGRVVERFGKELDRELRFNIKPKDYEEVTVDEKGKEKTTTTTVNVGEISSYSDYAKFFDESNANFTKEPEFNLMFLNHQQRYANQKLQSEGYLFLNEVYDMIGIPRTSAGQCVGWVYDLEHPNGDNYVDFGIFDINREKNRDFVNGYERSILLDFNVDGVILDLI